MFNQSATEATATLDSNDRLEAFLENSAVIGWMKDENGCHVYLSNNYQRVFKVKIDNWKGKTDFELWPKDIAEQFRKNDLKVLLDGNTIEVAEMALLPNGSQSWWLVSKFLFKDSFGRKYVGGLGVDITERKQAEEQLYNSEKKYRELTERMRELVYVADSSTFVTTYINQAVEEVYGYTQKEWLSDNALWEKTIHPDDYERVMSKFKEAQKDGENIVLEYRIVTNNGKIKWVEDRALWKKEEDENGNIIELSGILIDITERKKMTEALLQSEKLKSMETITAEVAHEFNNILAVISGNIEWLIRQYEDNLGLIDRLRTIKSATDDGNGITKRMLQFTKTEEGTSQFEPLDIKDAIEQAIDFTTPRWKDMAQSEAINYRINREGIQEVPTVLGNYVELRGMFINIINNALDAMPDGGCISFRTWSKDDAVFVSISDSGMGMSEEVMGKIFDPFFTTRLPQAAGLGMSIAYGIMKRHGGKIKVDSGIGKGSTFILQLPITLITTDPIVSVKPEQNTNSKSLRILVVDDEKNMCILLDEFLSDEGHKIKSVDNGADAIRLIRSEEYDLVLSDLVMPDVTGYDVIKAVNKLKKRPKIGILTGLQEKLDSLKKKGLKVDFIIIKPFDFSELIRHINDVINID